MFLGRLSFKQSFFLISFIVVSFLFSSCISSNQASSQNIVIYTTTSVYDSGILNYILKNYEKEKGLNIKLIAVGTGEALKNAEMGNADIVIVHSPKLEAEYLKKGVLKKRKVIAENFFVIAGPKSDPCSVSSSRNAAEAFKKIFLKQATFVSRGDNSGTHLKELEIWDKVGVNPKRNPNYIVCGSGMADALRIASEKQAYVLTDIATLILTKDVDLKVLFYKDEFLRNVYSVCLVSEEVIGKERYKRAEEVFSYLTSEEALSKIKKFSRSYSKKGYPPIYEPIYGAKR